MAILLLARYGLHGFADAVDDFPCWLTALPGFSFQGDVWGISPADAGDKTQV